MVVDGDGLPLKAPPVAGTGHLLDSGQRLGDSWSISVRLGDLDADGDLDALVANYGSVHDRVWLNDGKGGFAPGMALDKATSTSVDLGDLDGDGDLDAVITYRNRTDRAWLNDGSGQFVVQPSGLSPGMSRGVTLADLDGDGILDAVISSGGVGDRTPNSVWFGLGDGAFRQSSQELGHEASWQAAVADLDGDGDLDIVFANGDDRGDFQDAPNTVWLNDGNGKFEETGHPFASIFSRGVALGDLDLDGDLDALVCNNDGDQSGTWRNDGNLQFEPWDLSLGVGHLDKGSLFDLDGDGDLDLILPGLGERNVRWLNDGSGGFYDPQHFGTSGGNAGADVGDLDGDGDWDLFIPRKGGNEVWLNGSPPAGTSGSNALSYGDSVRIRHRGGSYLTAVNKHGEEYFCGAQASANVAEAVSVVLSKTPDSADSRDALHYGDTVMIEHKGTYLKGKDRAMPNVYWRPGSSDESPWNSKWVLRDHDNPRNRARLTRGQTVSLIMGENYHWILYLIFNSSHFGQYPMHLDGFDPQTVYLTLE